MIHSSRLLVFMVVVSLQPCLVAHAQKDNVPAPSWAQFRGPQASGVSKGPATPTQWDIEKDKNILWSTKIPGMSHAAPIVWGDRVYVTTAAGKFDGKLKVGLYGDIKPADDTGRHHWHLVALDRKTGKVIYDKVVHGGVPKVKRHTKATHCNSTPVTDGKRIVAILGSEGLFCFDMEGKKLWKKDLGPMDSGYFRVPSAQWGFASSPVMHDGKIVVQCDVQKGSFLALFNAEDGKEIWRTKRAEVPTWGTPTLVELDGKMQILVNGWKHTGAYDFETGKEIWKLSGGGDIPTPTPIVAHGFAYFTSGHGRWRPIRAIRLDATGNITPPKPGDTNAHIKWAHERRGNYMQTPIIVGDVLWACYDTGQLTCFDAKTGKVHYRQRLGGRRQGFTASPVSDGKHVYFTGEKGDVYVIPAKSKLSVVAVNALKENCLSTPAIYDGTLFFRTQHKLIAVRAD